MSKPLEGIKIIDFTTVVSGPLATMILADQGAEVIKIEPPSGEQLRHAGYNYKGMTAPFISCNRNKKSLCLDIKKKDGQEIIKKILKTADVLVQNFRPNTANRIGIGEKEVRKINPKIIYVSISGVGDKGPYSDQRVYDPVIQALSGLADIQKEMKSGRPRMIRTIIADKVTALTAAQSITSAILSKFRTGKGQSVKLSMLDSMISFLWPEGISILSFVGNEGDPDDGQLGGDLVFKTLDGYMTAGTLSDKEWRGMCTSLKRIDLISDRRFVDAKSRSKNYPLRIRIIARELKKWKTKEILKTFVKNGVPCAPILKRKDILKDPQIISNNTFEIIDDNRVGKIRQPKPAAIFGKRRTTIKKIAPFLGEHNKKILRTLGYTAPKIKEFYENKTIFSDKA